MKHTLTVPNFVPTSCNRLFRGRFRDRVRLARGDKQVVAHYARESGIPPATGKRKVWIEVSMGPKHRGRLVDPDAPLKSSLDALVACGLLKDDSAALCEICGVRVVRGERRETVYTLQDVDL